MGARTNFELQDAKGSVWLYSHSGGDDKSIDFAKALEHARPRWGDTPYAIRMVVSHLIQDRLLDDTGYGLTSYEAGEESYDALSANFETKTVDYEQDVFTFEEFVKRFS
jgi:hypothetical protein|tara:strand:- start:98 stop:424 length:327 start_codon:yes stop_codon:yes gene_type:complete